MRVIRFRGKRLDNGEWAYGYYSVKLNTFYYKLFPSIQIVLNNGNVLARVEVDGDTVGQFTGESDINSYFIYEGDIVKYGSTIGVVNYKCGCFCVRDIVSQNNPAIDIILNEHRDDIEVIGNIYDNPNLIGGKNNETD